MDARKRHARQASSLSSRRRTRRAQIHRASTQTSPPVVGPHRAVADSRVANNDRARAAGHARAGPRCACRRCMQDDLVYYNGQPIGLVIADTFEHATAAAGLVKATYAEERPVLDIESTPLAPANAVRPVGAGGKATKRGDVEKGLAEAEVKVEHTYTTPLENHNPMEPHNTMAMWDGDKVTLYDSTQGIFSVRSGIARAFGIPPENVRVVSYFTGGGFGSKGGPWSHVYLAAMAAKHLSRPVKLVAHASSDVRAHRWTSRHVAAPHARREKGRDAHRR